MDSAISDVGVTTEIRNQHGHQHQLECRDLVGSRRITNHSSHGLERSWPFERMRSNSSINQGSSTGAQTEPKRGTVPQHRSAVDLQREAPLQRRLCALRFPNAYRTSLNIAPFASHRKWKQSRQWQTARTHVVTQLRMNCYVPWIYWLTVDQDPCSSLRRTRCCWGAASARRGGGLFETTLRHFARVEFEFPSVGGLLLGGADLHPAESEEPRKVAPVSRDRAH
jgi:hypothetical protein